MFYCCLGSSGYVSAEMSMMFSNFEMSLDIINLSFCIDRYS